MRSQSLETVLGAVVILVAALFLVQASRALEQAPNAGYEVHATFTKVGGLTMGADVRISGIKVGTVTDLTLDEETYLAKATLTLKQSLRVPSDSTVALSSAGLLGDLYVSLLPGSSGEALQPGERIRKTEDFQSLEDLVSEIIFLATNND